MLESRERELVALGAALASNCIPCIKFHIHEGRKVGLSDEEIDRRVAFIEERLDDGQLHAQIWQYGFTAGYGGAAIAFGAIFVPITGDKDARVNYITTAVKAAFGTARLL